MLCQNERVGCTPSDRLLGAEEEERGQEEAKEGGRGERGEFRWIQSITWLGRTLIPTLPQLLAVAAVASVAQAEEDLMALATAKSVVETRATVADRVRSRQAVAQQSQRRTQLAEISKGLSEMPATISGSVGAEKKATAEVEETSKIGAEAYEDIYEDEEDYVYEDDCIFGLSNFRSDDDGQDKSHSSRGGIFAQLLAEAKQEIDERGGGGLEAKLADANEDEPEPIIDVSRQRSSKIRQVQELCACDTATANHFLESVVCCYVRCFSSVNTIS